MSSSKHVNVAKMLSWLTSETVLPRVKLNALHNVFMSMPDEEKTYQLCVEFMKIDGSDFQAVPEYFRTEETWLLKLKHRINVFHNIMEINENLVTDEFIEKALAVVTENNAYSVEDFVSIKERLTYIKVRRELYE